MNLALARFRRYSNLSRPFVSGSAECPPRLLVLFRDEGCAFGFLEHTFVAIIVSFSAPLHAHLRTEACTGVSYLIGPKLEAKGHSIFLNLSCIINKAENPYFTEL